VTVEIGAVSIHAALRFLSRLHLLQLCLFEVRGDPQIVEIDDGDQRLPSLHDLSGLNGALADNTRERCPHRGVLQIELRLFQRRLRFLSGRLRRSGLGLLHLYLLRCCLGGAQVRLCLCNVALRRADGGIRGIQGCACRLLGSHLRIVLLARNLVFCDQLLEALQIRSHLVVVRLRFSLACVRLPLGLLRRLPLRCSYRLP
jgi:hypothetical protein